MKRQLEKFLYYSVRYSAFGLPFICLMGLYFGGIWSYSGFLIIFGYYFLVELILWTTGLGIATRKKEEFQYSNFGQPSFMDKYGVAIYGVFQILSLPMALLLMTTPSISLFEIVGGVLSFSCMIGSVGGLAGHEYIHRRVMWERKLGILIYGCIHYSHFTISHLLGHHRNVGLADDWSTSREGESSYQFLFRALFHGYVGAWKIETERLKRKKISFWSMDNFMIKSALSSVTLIALVYLAFGWKAVLIHSIISFVGMSLMEMVNYLSHYGLKREKVNPNQYEKISNKHSWESDNKVTNWFIFNAGKHCHHHRHPSDEHFQLVLAEENDYLPYGLPMMTLIALFPPLYFRLMSPLLIKSRGDRVTF